MESYSDINPAIINNPEVTGLLSSLTIIADKLSSYGIQFQPPTMIPLPDEGNTHEDSLKKDIAEKDAIIKGQAEALTRMSEQLAKLTEEIGKLRVQVEPTKEKGLTEYNINV